ncbi:hypothetical protein HPT27_08420 [Permianibacter sp. IMCC34836]|uniref:hypothetical protein n=1 Tax=Permianibacter fluminis TaxID=2738515 RepID=UPI0015582D4E|nr:hypothetical protein [Permianibacter fluminis]NQD37046.1 hypothetical protein [Permianibacter fluminis]
MHIFIGFAYATINLFFMMWYGISRHNWEGPKSMLGISAGYVAVVLVAIYVPLWFARKKTRTAAFIGLLPPWLLLGLIAIPQQEAPQMLLCISGIFSTLFFARLLLEPIFAKLNNE